MHECANVCVANVWIIYSQPTSSRDNYISSPAISKGSVCVCVRASGCSLQPICSLVKVAPVTSTLWQKWERSPFPPVSQANPELLWSCAPLYRYSREKIIAKEWESLCALIGGRDRFMGDIYLMHNIWVLLKVSPNKQRVNIPAILCYLCYSASGQLRQ